MKKLDIRAILLAHLHNGSTPTQAIEAAAFVMRNDGSARGRFRDNNEFLDNCLGCAESFYGNLSRGGEAPLFVLGKRQRSAILVSMGFDFSKGNRLMA
jgi:hypothetical protein